MSNLEEKGREKANKLLDKINSSKHIRPLVQAGLLFMKHSMQIYSGYATLYILMAMIPLLMFVVSVVNMIPSFSVENISSLLSAIFPELPQIHNMIEDIVLNLNSQSSGFLATTTALIMFWSASNGVSAIQKGLEEINEKKSNVVKGKVVSLLFTLVVVVVLVFLMLFQLLRQPLMDFVVKILTTLRLTNAIPFFTTFMQYSYLISIATSIISIVMIYTILPSGKMTFRSQFPGAVLAIVVSGLFTFAFGFFMGTFWRASSFYGSMAAIFLMAMWLQFIIMIIFYGACLNKALLAPENITLEMINNNGAE